MIPTRDYLFAPAFADICQAVNFIHGKYVLDVLLLFSFDVCFVHPIASRKRRFAIVFYCFIFFVPW